MLVLKNDEQVLPASQKSSILAIVQRNEDVILCNDPVLSHQMLPNSLAGRFDSVDHVIVDETPSEIQIFETIARAKNADLIVFGLYGGRKLAAETIEMLEKLIALRPVVVLIAQSPYVIESLPAGVKGVICGFGITPFMFDAAADLIAGKLKPTAKLPVTVNNELPRGFAVEMK